jgi:hypothetical protein
VRYVIYIYIYIYDISRLRGNDVEAEPFHCSGLKLYMINCRMFVTALPYVHFCKHEVHIDSLHFCCVELIFWKIFSVATQRMPLTTIHTDGMFYQIYTDDKGKKSVEYTNCVLLQVKNK